MKRQLQKRETLLKNIDRDIAKIVEIDRLNLAKNLRTYGAPVKLKNLGRPSKFTQEELSKLPELIERIKKENGFKTYKQALELIVSNLAHRRGLSKAREVGKLQTQLSKARKLHPID